MLRLYIIGVAILVVAIAANSIANYLGIKSWYTFLELLFQNCTSAFSQLQILDYLWLFIFYPIILGCGYWIGDKLYTILFS